MRIVLAKTSWSLSARNRHNVGYQKGIVFVAFSLAGCATNVSQFAMPDVVRFGQDNFVKVTHSQIDEMQHLLYLPENSEKNPENWQKGILFFLDKNSKIKL